MDEKHLLHRARQGNADAFCQLIQPLEQKIYRMVYRSVRAPEQAADVTQEVFLRAWQSIGGFRGDSGFATWLHRIAYNCCIDYARRQRAQPELQPLPDSGEADELQSPAKSPEQHLLDGERDQMLRIALDTLSEDHRQILLLRECAELSYTELAEVLEISEGTVKSRLCRARLALREALLQGNYFAQHSSKQAEGGGTYARIRT